MLGSQGRQSVAKSGKFTAVTVLVVRPSPEESADLSAPAEMTAFAREAAALMVQPVKDKRLCSAALLLTCRLQNVVGHRFPVQRYLRDKSHQICARGSAP